MLEVTYKLISELYSTEVQVPLTEKIYTLYINKTVIILN